MAATRKTDDQDNPHDNAHAAHRHTDERELSDATKAANAPKEDKTRDDDKLPPEQAEHAGPTTKKAELASNRASQAVDQKARDAASNDVPDEEEPVATVEPEPVPEREAPTFNGGDAPPAGVVAASDPLKRANYKSLAGRLMTLVSPSSVAPPPPGLFTHEEWAELVRLQGTVGEDD